MSDIYGHFEEVWSDEEYDQLTTLHGDRMTREKLHSKQPIAAELAWRDKGLLVAKAEIERLNARINKMHTYNCTAVNCALDGDNCTMNEGLGE